jgi:DNA modification methylase
MSACRQRMYDTAARRWAGIGPYYAMFPTAFADRVILRYTCEGETVLDPFAGRGTALFSAASHGRIGIGIEINPVGWVYGMAKLRPASELDVIQRLKEIENGAWRFKTASDQLAPFFKLCFAPRVREFLVAARAILDWRRRMTDWTTMALLIVYLHGKHDAAFSNQMRQTKSMAPNYAIKWWRRKHLQPPHMDPVEFMHKRVKWRYAKGLPEKNGSAIYLGNSTRRLSALAKNGHSKASLLFTSPPYCGVTNYHYDQWLRLWLLGGPETPIALPAYSCGRFADREQYKLLLETVFTRAARLLKRDAVVYVRTDRRSTTYEATKAALRFAFPNKRINAVAQPYRSPTQTRLFGSSVSELGEIDLILQPS